MRLWTNLKFKVQPVDVLRSYLIYNKPWVLKQWFKEAKPVQEYYLILDSDMTIHRPFLPTHFQVGPGICPDPHHGIPNHVWILSTFILLVSSTHVGLWRPSLVQR